MMNNHQQQQTEIYYEQPNPSRSPSARGVPQQQQMLHQQQPSRPFDTYGTMPNNMYTPDDQALRYETNRFDRMNGPMQPVGGYGYDPQQAQTWNPNAFSSNTNFSAYPSAATSRVRSQTGRGRTNLPATWMDQQQMTASSPYPGGIGPSPLGISHLRSDQYQDPDEELIPTAIVIKNIPFAVKKEQLVELMTQMSLPLPYAFNYHFDNGVFRGLAFANFTSADETHVVIEALNHYDLQGRKLRVEYKKMLPLQERERIEREKRERRGQLEEQHRPIAGPQLHNQPSMSSMSSHRMNNTPSPIGTNDVQPDLNDPQTLSYYSELLIFKGDRTREVLIFPSSLMPTQRRIVHTLAHHMSLAHVSRGNGESRQVHVFHPDGQGPSPPLPQMSLGGGDSSRRGLNRAATIDFNEARNNEQQGLYNTNTTLRGQQSSSFLGIPDSPGGGLSAAANLRGAKSVADLRSYSPSPVPSASSFPANLQPNIARFQQQQQQSQDYQTSSTGATGGTPTMPSNVSPTASGQDGLVNGFGSMNLGNGLGNNNGGSPRRLRNMMTFPDPTTSDRDGQQVSSGPASAGTIGSNRSFSMNTNSNNYVDNGQDRGLPLRQPRGPGERGAPGFSRGRQNGHQARGSDELRNGAQQPGVEIIVE